MRRLLTLLGGLILIVVIARLVWVVSSNPVGLTTIEPTQAGETTGVPVTGGQGDEGLSGTETQAGDAQTTGTPAAGASAGGETPAGTPQASADDEPTADATATRAATPTRSATNTPRASSTPRATATRSPAAAGSTDGGDGTPADPASSVDDYRAELERQSQECTVALETFEEFTNNITQNPALVFDPNARPRMNDAMEEINNTCGELGQETEVPAEFAEVDSTLEQAAEEFRQMTDKFNRGVQSVDPALLTESLEHLTTANELVEEAQAALP